MPPIPGPDRYVAGADGAYLGVHRDAVDPETGEVVAAVTLPDGAVEVPAPPPAAGRVWDGYGWVPDPDYVPLLAAQAKVEIDRRAEEARLLWITPGSGQAAVYLAKADEALRLQADGDPDPAEYPLLSASIGIEGASLGEVAAVVLAMRAGWLQVAAAIEAIRLGGKAAVAALGPEASAEDLQVVLDGLSWPAPEDAA